MNANLKKRLDAVDRALQPADDKYGVVFIPLEAETDEEMDARIARWYAGEKVEGQDRIFTGRERIVGRIRYVPACTPHLDS